MKALIKKWFTKKGNIVFALLLAFVLLQQLPVLINNFSKKDIYLSSRELKVLNSKEYGTVAFPPKDAKAIAIFWASWCGPCKIEMSRLKKSVESGAIPRNGIFAINPFESNFEARKFIQQNNYPFTFIEASSLTQELGVKVTPTIVLINKNIITEISSGMSIWGIWKAEFFF